VQHLHLLQADGMVYCWTCPLRNHDSVVLRKLGMLLMLSAMYVDDDPERPVKCVTDKAYGRTVHLHPIHTDAELCLMRPQQQAVCIAIDKCNRKPRLSVENSFNNQVTKFKPCDHIRSNKIVRDGKSNWPYLRCLWDMKYSYSIFLLVLIIVAIKPLVH
jgi:hypothetical protein